MRQVKKSKNISDLRRVVCGCLCKRQQSTNHLCLLIYSFLCMSIIFKTPIKNKTIKHYVCLKVLNAVENLKIELNNKNPNKDMCNLVIDTCSDSLCATEAKVNTAVLRLCLKMFSEYKRPMENLYNHCKQLQKFDKDILDPLITKFDLHMDRIFQICTFSIASASMGKRMLIDITYHILFC